jgi:hypothetical protein
MDLAGDGGRMRPAAVVAAAAGAGRGPAVIKASDVILAVG